MSIKPYHLLFQCQVYTCTIFTYFVFDIRLAATSRYASGAGKPRMDHSSSSSELQFFAWLRFSNVFVWVWLEALRAELPGTF